MLGMHVRFIYIEKINLLTKPDNIINIVYYNIIITSLVCISNLEDDKQRPPVT